MSDSPYFQPFHQVQYDQRITSWLTCVVNELYPVWHSILRGQSSKYLIVNRIMGNGWFFSSCSQEGQLMSLMTTCAWATFPGHVGRNYSQLFLIHPEYWRLMSSHKDQHETLSVHVQEWLWLAHRYLHIFYLQI